MSEILGVKRGEVRVGEVQAEILRLIIDKQYKCFTPSMLGRELRERGFNIRNENVFQSLLKLEARNIVKRVWRGIYCVNEEFLDILDYLELKVKPSGAKKTEKEGGES